mgnify:CR=1 FL=1
MLTNPLPDGKITVEGHLRIAGDGFEYADIYVDSQTLKDILAAWMPRAARRKSGNDPHNWVVEPCDWETGPDYPEPWTPIDRHAVNLKYDEAMLRGEEPQYVFTCDLSADFGPVRITIEPLAGE